jgi:hypothetical protein
MTTIINRKALVHYGHCPESQVAYLIRDAWHGDRTVTWAEVMAERRERQARILSQRRCVGADLGRAVRLWVAYFDQDLMGGWQAFLDDYRGRSSRLWIDRDSRYDVRPLVMRLFPLTLFGWEEWKVAFAAAYRKRRKAGRPVGVAYLWQRGGKYEVVNER